MIIDNPDMFILSFHQAILMVIASIIILYSSIKHRELFRWLPAYILLTIALFYNSIWYFIDSPRIISYVFYLSSIISILLPIYFEYYSIFIKPKQKAGKLKKFSAITIFFNPIILGIEILVLCLVIISLIMLIRIYFRKKTLIHFFLFSSLFAATLTIISMITQDFNVIGSIEFQYSSSFVFIAFLIATSFASIIDQKLRESEKKIRESESFFRNIAENIDAGLTIIENNKVIYLNERLSEILGYSKKDLMKLTMMDIALIEEKDRLKMFLESIENNKASLNKIDVWISTKKGEKRCIHNHYAKVIANGNKTTRYILTADITDRKIFEKKLKESEENYKKAYERVNLYKDLFTHNMNNILHAFMTSLDIFNLEFKQGKNKYNIPEFQKGLKEQIKRGVNLINAVQKFSEIEESKKKLKSINIMNVLNEAIQIVKEEFIDKRIDTQINSENKKIFILADEFLIDVFINIVTNAVKHNINQDVEILVNISETNNGGIHCLKMEFIDNGRGIPDSMKKNIFLRGIRGNKSVSGLGLGLSILINILDKYGAKIKVEDRIKDDHSQGSNFILLFHKMV